MQTKLVILRVSGREYSIFTRKPGLEPIQRHVDQIEYTNPIDDLIPFYPLLFGDTRR